MRLTRARIGDRHRGALLGGAWTIVLPLLMLGIYHFAFSEVFRARWDDGAAGGVPFALRLFAGMIVFNVFAECVNEAPGLMFANQAQIKQILFPTEVLAWVSVGAALWRFAPSLLLLVAFLVATHGPPPATSFWVLPALVPLVLLALGASWLLSSLGVFLRDLSQVVTVFTSALLFLSPVFYPASRVPEWMSGLYELNPLTTILESVRGALFEARAPEWPLAVVTAVAFVVAALGHAWFVRTKGSFADVL